MQTQTLHTRDPLRDIQPNTVFELYWHPDLSKPATKKAISKTVLKFLYSYSLTNLVYDF